MSGHEDEVGGRAWNHDRLANPHRRAAAPDSEQRTALRVVPHTDADRLIAAFERFHAENPVVFEVMRNSAIEWCRQFGRQVVGPSLVFGKVRWEVALRTNDPTFKLNNNHSPFYFRLIMHRHPELAGMFRTRRSVADSWIADLKQREQGEAAA